MHRARTEAFVVEVEFAQGGFDDILLIVRVENDKVAVIGDMFDFTAQDAGADRVEGAEHQPLRKLRTDQIFNAFLHLACGFVGESYRENLVGTRTALADEMGDTLGEYARLAGAGSRQHKDGTFASGNGFFLLRIKRIKHRVKKK